MSEPTYRIEITYDPQNESFPWDARVYRIADGKKMWFAFGHSQDEAEASARKMIARADRAEPGRTVYADENGEAAPEPSLFSVKA